MQNMAESLRVNVGDPLSEILAHKSRAAGLVDLLIQAGSGSGSAVDGNTVGCACSFIMDELKEVEALAKKALVETARLEKEMEA